MNGGKKNIFSGSHHFTSDELVRYVHHVLNEQEQHEMEKHLVDCELCSEALKGIAEMENASLLYEVNKDLQFRARRKRLLKKKIFSQNELISIFAVVFLIVFLLRSFLYEPFKIPSESMLPTLQIGDHLLVDKGAYKTHEPRRGDVIVFPYPRDPSKNFIKRVVAVGGDTIEIRHKVVSLNGSTVDDPHATFKYGEQEIPGPRDNFGPITIPPHKLFVMGDNRDESHDSRFWGFVDCGVVLGKAKVIYWSWDADALRVRWERISQVLE